MPQLRQRGLLYRNSGSKRGGIPAVVYAALALFSGRLGCSPDSGTVVVISTAGLTADVQSIRATASLSGQTDVEVYTTGLGEFGMRLPAGATGFLGVTLEGLRADQCVIASGNGSVVAMGQSRADIGVTLLPLTAPACNGSGGPTVPLTVTKSAGNNPLASGVITSMPAGINCGATCTASFAQGSMVTLGVTADYGSLFTGWSGGCTASGGSCQATLNGATTAAAAFATTTCSQDRLCEKLLMPPATPFQAIWGTSATDLWVVGAAGSILHWDGALFTPVTSGTNADLYSIWGASATDFWIGAAGGLVLRWNRAPSAPS